MPSGAGEGSRRPHHSEGALGFGRPRAVQVTRVG